MNLSPEEAARALEEVEASRRAMRTAIKSHRGHLHLWLWGCVWMAISTVNWIYGIRALPAVNGIAVLGVLASVGIGIVQSRQIRVRLDRRFLAVCATLILFGYGIWPVLLGGFHNYKAASAYMMIIWMQLYIVAGIWFDSCLLWIGIAVTCILMGAVLFLPDFFWASSLLCGLTLFASGFYIRYNFQ
jgi:hypothetical protein